MGGRGPVVSAGEARRGRLNVDFRDFAPADLEACLHVFDTNVPDFFTYEERDLFADFLREAPPGFAWCRSRKLTPRFELSQTRPWIKTAALKSGLSTGSTSASRDAPTSSRFPPISDRMR